MANIDVTRIVTEPNNCPFEEHLDLEIEFTTSADLTNAVWEVKFIADQAHKRQIIDLGKSASQSYSKGKHVFKYHVPAIPTGSVKKNDLANVGLFLANLHQGSEELVQVSMVTQVAPRGDRLYRTVFNPLD
eukprot:Colp12_sorted_trinity150504_noHs@33858